MEKTKVKKATSHKSDSDSVPAPVKGENLTAEENEKLAKEEKRLRNKVASLIKKQKKQQALGIVKGRDQAKPWGQEAQVKVCNIWICSYELGRFILFVLQCRYYIFQVGSRLIQLLIETAYLEPPANKFGDGGPDIFPAFKHTLKTISNDSKWAWYYSFTIIIGKFKLFFSFPFLNNNEYSWLD